VLSEKTLLFLGDFDGEFSQLKFSQLKFSRLMGQPPRAQAWYSMRSSSMWTFATDSGRR
jgi:hypothetical protein